MQDDITPEETNTETFLEVCQVSYFMTFFSSLFGLLLYLPTLSKTSFTCGINIYLVALPTKIASNHGPFVFTPWC